MIETAFVIGFFTALGWWSAGKLTSAIDKQPPQPPVIIQQQKEVK